MATFCVSGWLPLLRDGGVSRPPKLNTNKKIFPIKSLKGLFEPDPSQPVVLFSKPELSVDVQLDVLALVCCAWSVWSGLGSTQSSNPSNPDWGTSGPWWNQWYKMPIANRMIFSQAQVATPLVLRLQTAHSSSIGSMFFSLQLLRMEFQ